MKKSLTFMALFFLLTAARAEIYRVTGMGAPPAGMPAARAKAMACRAAQVDAYRQLAEIVKGVQVDAQTTVENFVVQSDEIRTKVDATIQGAAVVGKREMPDGSCEVDIELDGSKVLEVMPPPADVKPAKPAPPPPDPPKVDKPATLFHSTYIKRGNWNEKAREYNEQGLEAGRQGDLEAAISYYQQAIAADPNMDIAWSNLAGVYQKLGDFEQAERAYQEAIRIDPNWSYHYVQLGWLYFDAEQKDQAMSYAKTALQKYDKNPWAYDLQGYLQLIQGKFPEAVKSYEKAVQVAFDGDGFIPLYHFFLGQAYLKTGQKEKAKAQFKKALALRSDYWEAEEALKGI